MPFVVPETLSIVFVPPSMNCCGVVVPMPTLPFSSSIMEFWKFPLVLAVINLRNPLEFVVPFPAYICARLNWLPAETSLVINCRATRPLAVAVFAIAAIGLAALAPSSCTTLPLTAKSVAGLVVPMPTLPALVMIKLVAVEEPTTKEGPEIPLGFTDNCPKGEVVPMPSRLLESSQKRFELS